MYCPIAADDMRIKLAGWAAETEPSLALAELAFNGDAIQFVLMSQSLRGFQFCLILRRCLPRSTQGWTLRSYMAFC